MLISGFTSTGSSFSVNERREINSDFSFLTQTFDFNRFEQYIEMIRSKFLLWRFIFHSFGIHLITRSLVGAFHVILNSSDFFFGVEGWLRKIRHLLILKKKYRSQITNVRGTVSLIEIVQNIKLTCEEFQNLSHDFNLPTLLISRSGCGLVQDSCPFKGMRRRVQRQTSLFCSRLRITKKSKPLICAHSKTVALKPSYSLLFGIQGTSFDVALSTCTNPFRFHRIVFEHSVYIGEPFNFPRK